MTRQQRVVQLPLYAVLVMIAVGVLSPILSVVASVRISDRATDQQIGQLQAQADELRAEQRARACSLYGALISALEEEPPQGAAGQNLLDEYRRQYKIRDCGPS